MGRRKRVVRKKKKVSRKKRDAAKHPGLNKHFFSKIKQEYHDYDYINKLSDKEKDWLSNFTEEYLGANLKHKGKKLHKTDELRKDCYRKNNYRQRDLYSIKKATGNLDMEDKLIILEEPQENEEDRLIDLIDSGNEPGEEA